MGEGMITQSLIQDLEALNKLEGEGGLPTEDLARKKSIKFELGNRLHIWR